MSNLDKEILERLIALAANVHFLTKKVDNVEWRCIAIERMLQERVRSATDILMSQTLGGTMGVITGVHAGGAPATFALSTLPAGSVLLPGSIPAYSVDDPNALLSAAPDGMSGSITYSVVDPLPASFNVTVNAQGFDASGNAVAITHVFPWRADHSAAASGVGDRRGHESRTS